MSTNTLIIEERIELTTNGEFDYSRVEAIDVWLRSQSPSLKQPRLVVCLSHYRYSPDSDDWEEADQRFPIIPALRSDVFDEAVAATENNYSYKPELEGETECYWTFEFEDKDLATLYKLAFGT